MPTRLLAIDIDGTLLTRERVPHPENVAAIQRAQQEGITVVLASGRIAASIAQFSDELGLDGAMICCNGAHVRGPGGAELMHVNLDQEAIDQTFAYAQEFNVHTNSYTRYELFFIGDSTWGKMYRQRVRAVEPQIATLQEIRLMPLLKIILIDEPAAIQKHRLALDRLLSPDIAFLTESEPDYLEVLPPGANKGKALQELAQHMGIRQSETAAIGDYLNDLEMVQWAGIGAAVGNALEEVKSVADICVPANDDAGVARFIDFLLEENLREG